MRRETLPPEGRLRGKERAWMCVTHLLSTYCEPGASESIISLRSLNSPLRWGLFLTPILQMRTLRLRKAKVCVKVMRFIRARARTQTSFCLTLSPVPCMVPSTYGADLSRGCGLQGPLTPIPPSLSQLVPQPQLQTQQAELSPRPLLPLPPQLP